jgi:signal peptidase II
MLTRLYWISGGVIVADQVSKYLAETLLVWRQPLPVMPFLNLYLTYNTGAAFSLLSDASGWQRWLFILLALAVSVFIVVWVRRLGPGQGYLVAALCLILGGALGNVIDRIVHGHVIDFIDVYYRHWHWPAFNIADSAITIGVIIIILDGIAGRKAPGS